MAWIYRGRHRRAQVHVAQPQHQVARLKQDAPHCLDCCRGRGVRRSAHLAEAIVEVGGEKQWEKRALCEHSDVKIFFGVCPHDTS